MHRVYEKKFTEKERFTVADPEFHTSPGRAAVSTSPLARGYWILGPG